MAMAKQIFISSSSKDHKAALTLCNAIEARGYACWISSRDVGPGENFQEAIVHALANARLMILVFSANANNSGEIKKEIALASQNQMIVIPFRIEDVVPNEAFRYEFATRQWIDAFDDWERAIGQLLGQISRALDVAGPGPADPPPPPVRGRAVQPETSSRFPVWAYAAGAAILVVLAGLGVYLSGSLAPKAPATTAAQMAAVPPSAPQTASTVQPDGGGPSAGVRAALTEALAAFDRADYGKSLQLYKQAAAEGNAQAEYNVGLFYERGYGVPKDYAQALQWYRKAAAQGDAAAECGLAVFYQNGLGGLVQDDDLAMLWYQKSAAQGYAYAVAAVSKLKAAHAAP
jgi:hypothetical protein